ACVADPRIALGLLCLGHAIDDALHLALAVDIHGGLVRLGWLAVNALGLLRQLDLAIVAALGNDAALRQVIGHPFLLRSEIGFDIGGVAAILVGGAEQVFLPFDAVGAGELVIEAGVLRIHARLRQRIGDAPPACLRIGLRRLVGLPYLLLLIERGGGD